MIRKICGLLALGLLIYEGFQILAAPTGGLSFLQFIRTTDNVNLQLAAFAACVALLVLLVLAFGKTRYILQEQRIEELRKTVENAVPWLEKVERRHRDLASLKTELQAIGVRLQMLGAPSTGFAALYRQIDQAYLDVNAKMQHVGRDESGNDLVGLIEQLAQAVANIGKRIDNFEAAIKLVPELAAAADGFERRVEFLRDARDELIAQITSLRERFDKLLNDSSIKPQETPRTSEVGSMRSISSAREQTAFDKVFLHKS